MRVTMLVSATALALLLSVCAALSSPSAVAADQSHTYYQQLEARCRPWMQTTDWVDRSSTIIKVDAPATLIRAGYAEFIPDYLDNLGTVEWPSTYDHHPLYLALASKKYGAHQREVVEWLNSWQTPPPVPPKQPTEADLFELVVKFWEEDPGTQSVYRDAGAGASYIALSVMGGPVAEQIISQAVDYNTRGMPPRPEAALSALGERGMRARVRASLALAAHLIGDSQGALEILDVLVPEEVTLEKELLDATKAWIEGDTGRSSSIKPEQKLGVFCVLADAAGVDDLEPFGEEYWIEMLASLGYLMLGPEEGDVQVTNVPFQCKLDRAKLYDHLRRSQTKAFCRTVAWLGDDSQKEVLRSIMNGSPHIHDRVDAEFALILLGEDLEPSIARKIISRSSRSGTVKAWLRDNTAGRLISLLRRVPWEPSELVYANAFDLRGAAWALGVVGTPDDIPLLLSLIKRRYYPYPDAAGAAIIQIIRRHNLSGPQEPR